MPIVSQTRIFNLCSARAGYLTCAPIEQVSGIDPMKGGGSSKPPPPKKQKGMSDFFCAKPKRTETEIQQSQEEDRAVVKQKREDDAAHQARVELRERDLREKWGVPTIDGARSGGAGTGAGRVPVWVIYVQGLNLLVSAVVCGDVTEPPVLAPP